MEFDSTKRQELLEFLLPSLNEFYNSTADINLSTDWDIPSIKKFSRAIPLERPNDPKFVLGHVLDGLRKYAVHTPHPAYFGLFNPRANYPSIIADLITATFNPQLAAWSHAPFANEIENYLVESFGEKFGYPRNSLDGTFCSGGAESNLTAIIAALNDAIPNFNKVGLFALSNKPLIYCSSESHHSIVKAAKIVGLGEDSVRTITVTTGLKINIEALEKQITVDVQSGFSPLMIIGTAGTTGAGAIDDLRLLSHIALKHEMWFHVDAAFGGASIISKKFKSYLDGIEDSDSITLDLHKWFSIPMGASLFLTRNTKVLHNAFGIHTDYMPENDNPNYTVDPYVHSIQWSRRFMGLKMYLPLAIFGWEGYEKIINHHIEMGILLKNRLQQIGWEIKNNTHLPIICFAGKNKSDEHLKDTVAQINNSGKAWVSIYPVHGRNTMRACITNYMTTEKEIDIIIDLLESSST